MRQTPSVKPQGHFNAWPEYFHSFADKVAQEPKMRRPRPYGLAVIVWRLNGRRVPTRRSMASVINGAR
ncbi:MAG: hypothetical protein COC12_03115 [Rhodobacteraceae bacterium]|nr:MAG: hypothetical protein COC12_03115 [Paracoccaceae bacterium]